MIRTVHGSVDSNGIGLTLMHQHLSMRHSEEAGLGDPIVVGLTRDGRCAVIESVVRFRDEARRLQALLGVPDLTPCIVDLSCRGLGCDLDFLRRVQAETGVWVVHGAGYYKDDAKWIDQVTQARTAEDLADLMIKDLLTECGIIGEVGVSWNGVSAGGISAFERKSLRAAAIAYFKTGAPISLHLEQLNTPDVADLIIDAALHQLRLDDGSVVPEEKIIIGHMHASADHRDVAPALFEHAKKERYIEFDFTLGEDPQNAPAGLTDAEFRVWLMEPFRYMIEYANTESVRMGADPYMLVRRILFSPDIYRQSLVQPYGYEWGVQQLLRFAAGNPPALDAENIKTLMVENPRRLLDWA